MENNAKLTLVKKGNRENAQLFFSSVGYSLKAIKHAVKMKGVKKYFIIPFLLNIILLGFILYFSFTATYPWLKGLIGDGTSWYLTFFRYALIPLLVILFGILTILVYSILGSIITAPFNDPLSARVEKELAGPVNDGKFSFVGFMGDIYRSIKNAVKLLLMMVILNVIIFPLNIIPVAGNIAYIILSFLVNSFFMGFQFYDFSLERRKYSFREKLRICWSFRGMVVGTGAGFFIFSWIPVAGFLSLNLATIAATEQFVKKIKPLLE